VRAGCRNVVIRDGARRAVGLECVRHTRGHVQLAVCRAGGEQREYEGSEIVPDELNVIVPNSPRGFAKLREFFLCVEDVRRFHDGRRS